MSDGPRSHGVQLPDGESASSFLLSLLRDAKAEFPHALHALRVPRHGKELKRRFSPTMIDMERLRVEAPERTQLAIVLQRAVAERCVLRNEWGERPLTELGLTAKPLPIERVTDERAGGWVPQVTFRDRVFRGHALEDLVEVLDTERQLDRSAADALRRSLKRLDADGALHLEGERFALFGAGAELAPTAYLLRAGASVLYTDVVPPRDELLRAGGTLWHANGASDLLTVPDRVAATMATFAAKDPAHIGLFAYGPGQGREWRLGAAMNAALRALPREMVQSVGLLISPTTPAALADDDARATAARWEARPSWQRALLAARVLEKPRGRRVVSDTVVPLQGVSYQAAQWIEKTLAMEAIGAVNPGLPISANVAPITNTSSMGHPVFQAGFRGAPAFAVGIYDPEVTRTLSTLIYVEDILGELPDRPRHFHGGTFAMSTSLESAIRAAAVLGFAKR